MGGLLAFGVLLAITSWMGVAWHLTPLALTSEGLWRGASTITYANALAGVLVPLALTALALLSAKERSVPLALVATLLLLGVATTLSRAGVLALVAGLTLLVLIRGAVVLRSLLAPRCRRECRVQRPSAIDARGKPPTARACGRGACRWDGSDSRSRLAPMATVSRGRNSPRPDRDVR